MGNNTKGGLSSSQRFETIFPEQCYTKKMKTHRFLCSPFWKKIASTDQHKYDRSDLQGCTENMFYSEKNSSKLCAEGAIRNLMNVLHCPENEVKQFWDIVQSPVQVWCKPMWAKNVLNVTF